MRNFDWLITNNWFIGIITGVISGILLELISNYVLENRKKIEKKKRIAVANDAVLTLLRPHIANSGLPSMPQLEAIISSISRQHEVNAGELNSPKMICEDLIVEFIGNVYIPADLKMERIKKLLEFIELSNIHSCTTTNSTVQSPNITTKIKKVGIFACEFASAITIFSGIIASWLGTNYFNLIAVIISICSLFVSLVAYVLTKTKSRKKERFIKTLNSSRFKELKVMNCGTSLQEPYIHGFNFFDYFDEGE